MNYRHEYHAGNFADVLKHAVLALVIGHLARKATPFRVVDTHAGAGCYDLDRGPAERTGEWRGGIARLLGPGAPAIPAAVAGILAPYLAVVRSLNGEGELRRYPGSPLLARRLLRSEDRLIVNELHPQAAADLARLFAGDRQTKVLALDGWIALKSLLPPRERRGIVLIDPPFEQPDEFGRIEQGLGEAASRFPAGVYIVWYPVKDVRPVLAFQRRLLAAGHRKLLDVRLMVRPATAPGLLNGCGLLVRNAPFQLDIGLAELLPFLAERLAEQEGAGHVLRWLD